MKYFIIDVGDDMIQYASMIAAIMKSRNYNYIMYESNDLKFMSIEEVTADEFANHKVIAMNEYFEN